MNILDILGGGRKSADARARRRRCPAEPSRSPTAETHFVNHQPLKGPYPEGSETALFGLGCFWGAERAFWKIPGVHVTAVGYAGGITPNPTYQEVCSGQTGHNEVVLVVYDPKAVTYAALVKASSRRTTRRRACARATTSARSTAPASTSPTTSSGRPRKRPRRSTRRRSRRRATARSPPRSSIAPAFYFAEDYHQQYLAKNPNGYCGLGGTGVACPIGVGRWRQP